MWLQHRDRKLQNFDFPHSFRPPAKIPTAQQLPDPTTSPQANGVISAEDDNNLLNGVISPENEDKGLALSSPAPTTLLTQDWLGAYPEYDLHRKNPTLPPFVLHEDERGALYYLNAYAPGNYAPPSGERRRWRCRHVPFPGLYIRTRL